MSELFEDDVVDTPEPVEEPVEEPGEENIEMEIEAPPKKIKKARKPLTDERKAQLREQLKKGRENSLAKRQAAKKQKQKKKIMADDIDNMKIGMQHSNTIAGMEDLVTQRVMHRLKKEREADSKNSELEKLRAELAELKKAKATPPKLETIKEKVEPVEPAKPKVSATPYNKFSPIYNNSKFNMSKHFMF